MEFYQSIKYLNYEFFKEKLQSVSFRETTQYK